MVYYRNNPAVNRDDHPAVNPSFKPDVNHDFNRANDPSFNPAIAEFPVPDPGWLLADHYIKSSDYACRRSQGSKAWLMFFTMGGEGCVRVNQEEFACRHNNITIIKPGTPHDYFTKSGGMWDFYWVYFVPRMSWMEWLRIPEAGGWGDGGSGDRGGSGISAVSVPETELQTRIVHAFERMIGDCGPLDAIQQQLALNAVEEILLLLYRKAASQMERKLDSRIAATLDLLKQNYEKTHTIDKLAAAVHLSPSRLSHLFKAQTGQTIVDTLLKIRLDKAASLLHMTSMSVADTAEVAGFHSLNYFAKKFKLFYGVSPSGYSQSR